MTERIEYNIRYLGFESLPDASRRFVYALTSQGKPSRKASVQIPAEAYVGPNRITFQESAPICSEKLRRALAMEGDNDGPLSFVLSVAEIEEISPRRRPTAKDNEP